MQGIALQASLNEAGIVSVLCDAADFLYFTKIPPKSTIIFLSRSGKSIEIVQAIAKYKLANAAIISITNADDTLLADSSDCCLLTYVKYDNSISVSTYSSIVLTGQLLALAVKIQLIIMNYGIYLAIHSKNWTIKYNNGIKHWMLAIG
jgi:glutamine---fructose-6-phosphate transaminase (isomerizing)